MRTAFMVGFMVIGIMSCSRLDKNNGLGFMPTELPMAQVGSEYRVEILIAGASTPVAQVVVVNGALPEGITLEHKRGEPAALIIGVPVKAVTSNFTLSASCFGTNVHGKVGEHTYELLVNGEKTMDTKSIGTARMNPDGTILLELRAEDLSGGATGDGRFEYPVTHPDYNEIMKHLSGLKPGEEKSVLPWPDAP